MRILSKFFYGTIEVAFV